MLLTQLDERGWTCIKGISESAAFIELAHQIGHPVVGPSGRLIKEIVPTSADKANPRTLSASFGRGAFPFHTDTAFWPIPVRYVLLRVRGDIRRQTAIWPFASLLKQCEPRVLKLAKESVWLVRAPAARFYCSMAFRCNDIMGWRYDRNCMYPANAAAIETERLMEPFIYGNEGQRVNLSSDDALVVDNWLALHARGPAPADESERVLERIYVR